MAKVHSINIGGKERTLQYTFKSARDLSRQSAILNGGKVCDWTRTVDDDSIDGMAIMVCFGLRHEVKDLVPDTVLDWFEQARVEGREVFKEFVLPAKRALGESGSTGSYFTYNEDGRFTKDLAGKGAAAGV